MKCGNLERTSEARKISQVKCKNCVKSVCLNCEKEFIISNETGRKVTKLTRKFCYECLPYPLNHTDYQRLYNTYIINKIKEIYGYKCNICGYEKCFDALDFHHINPKEKEYESGWIIHSCKPWEKIKDELDKCILLCANCHREVHFNLRNSKTL